MGSDGHSAAGQLPDVAHGEAARLAEPPRQQEELRIQATLDQGRQADLHIRGVRVVEADPHRRPAGDLVQDPQIPIGIDPVDILARLQLTLGSPDAVKTDVQYLIPGHRPPPPPVVTSRRAPRYRRVAAATGPRWRR